MLDAFKGVTGAKAQKQAEDFAALIAAAREGRSALSAMLTFARSSTSVSWPGA